MKRERERGGGVRKERGKVKRGVCKERERERCWSRRGVREERVREKAMEKREGERRER